MLLMVVPEVPPPPHWALRGAKYRGGALWKNEIFIFFFKRDDWI